MKVGLKKIFIRLGKILLSIVLIILCIIGIYNFFYYQELRTIRMNLNSIKGARVIDIWGHDDVTLEEVSARIRINDSSEIVLGNLSKDVFNYPESVDIIEIGGKSFKWYCCSGNSIGWTLDIGTKGPLYDKLRISFNSPEDVIKNYDKIKAVIDSIPEWPKLAHYISKDKTREEYIGVVNKKSKDVDKLFFLIGVDDEFEFAKKLKWNIKEER